MAFDFSLNMEKLSLKIADEHTRKMTNNNYIEDDDVFLDEEKLINNIENGFITLTHLNCYIESYLNTIINCCMNYRGERLLKTNIEDKIEYIYLYYKKDIQLLKSLHCWEIFKIGTRVRNEMIHYKISSIGMGTGIPVFEIGKQSVDTYFTIDNMIKIYNGFIELSEVIAEHLDLIIIKNINIFGCDGATIVNRYVYDKSILDESLMEFFKKYDYI